MAIYFVDGEFGSDTNNGTSPETAWATIQKAHDTAIAGDIVYIKPWVYRELLTCKNSGSAGNEIVFMGDEDGEIWGIKGDVIVTNISSTWDSRLLAGNILTTDGKNYIRYEKITFIVDSAPISFLNSSNITLKRCKIYNYPISGTSVFYFIFTGVTADINILQNLICSYNYITSNHTFMQNIPANVNINVENNIIILLYQVASGYKAYLYDVSAAETMLNLKNNIIYLVGYNTILKNGSYAGDTIINNIIFCYNTSSTYISTFQNNYGYSSTGNLSGGLWIYKIFLNMFNQSNLKDLLTAILGEDIYGNPRTLGQGTDIGAIEFNPYPQKEEVVKRSGNYSLRLERASFVDKKIWLTAGNHTISVYTKWSEYDGTNKPQLIVKQDKYCGIDSDLVATAIGDGSDWEQLSVSFTLTKDAEVTYRLYARDTGINAVTYFDDDSYV